ncbi:peptidase M48 [Sphingomonas oleivorans]|uniref:Peptidase M48 n=2 Tax=Sphingomonas oleivorans TaxID=1735121 RepID=A0A2T5G0D0_9SPHN|nr:M48 family metalloprotease [Sphingomonas oleivorans]PTQ12421.1 peptidase M48 [Sphingomonas oleivorans]
MALFVILSLAVAVRPATAQSVLRDAETEALLNDMARPLIIAAGLQPNNVQLVLLQDKEVNAFVAGGQTVYIHSGLIAAADNINQVEGVVAHELGHITGGHIVRMGEGMKPATGITILSLLLGAAAMAAGGTEAGMGAIMAGQQAAMGKFLAFSRTVEASTDSAGARYLRGAGISGKGMMQFWDKYRALEYRYSSSYAPVDPYMQTHPRPADRAAALEQDLKSSPYWDKPTDPALEARFQRVKAKLAGFVGDPQTTLRVYPETDKSLPARYARAYAWHKAAYPDKAEAEIDGLIGLAPHDPYLLELKGQVLLESGKPKAALAPLREAVQRSGNAPLISALLGHALIASEDPANFDEARRVLKVSVARDNDNPFAWYQLGIVYAREGDQPRAALATAERYSLIGQQRLALASAEAAMRGIPQGTPDYLRAQDIVMASRAAAEDSKRRR